MTYYCCSCYSQHYVHSHNPRHHQNLPKWLIEQRVIGIPILLAAANAAAAVRDAAVTTLLSLIDAVAVPPSSSVSSSSFIQCDYYWCIDNELPSLGWKFFVVHVAQIAQAIYVKLPS